MKRILPLSLLSFLFTASIAVIHPENPVFSQKPSPTSRTPKPRPTSTSTPTPTPTPTTSSRIQKDQNNYNF